MNNTKSNAVNFLTVLKTAGAFIAFLIGSGFATGQEIMQFFVAYGVTFPKKCPYFFPELCHPTGWEFRRLKVYRQ